MYIFRVGLFIFCFYNVKSVKMSSDMSISDLATMIAAERTIVTKEKQDYDALEASLAEVAATFTTQVNAAVSTEQQITVDLAAINHVFDTATLDTRLNQIAQTASSFDQQMTNLQNTMEANNTIAKTVYQSYSSNITKVSNVKQSLNDVISKLSNYNTIINAAMTTAQAK